MNLKPSSRHWLFVASALLCLQTPVARAEIVSTDQVAAQNQAADQHSAEREKVRSFLERADVKDRLQALGVGGLMAEDRVAALSDDEVHALAGKIDAMPAGGNLSQSDLVIILLVAILVAIAI